MSEVTASVVAEDFAHTNPIHREPADRTFQEPDRSVGGLVRKDLDVRDPAVVVDRDVHELPSLADLRPHSRRVPTHDPVSRTHKPGEFLDIDVDQLTRPASHIPVRRLRRFQP